MNQSNQKHAGGFKATATHLILPVVLDKNNFILQVKYLTKTI